MLHYIGMASKLPARLLRELDDQLAGQVLTPASNGYDAARAVPVAEFAQVRPAAIARCRSADDVARSVQLARRTGVELALRSGGHCFAGRSSTRGLLVDVSDIDDDVVVAGQTVTVGAGARLADLYDALDPHGLCLAGGCGPSVGIAGLALGGGFGVLGRSAGLTCDQLLAAEVVLADGTRTRCDAEHHPELFWALRGAGGGQFAAVTRLTFRVIPAATGTVIDVAWDLDAAADLIGAWQTWAPDGPDELAASLLVQVARGRGDAHVFGAMLASERVTREVVRQLVALVGTDPASLRLTPGSFREVKAHLAAHDPAASTAPDSPAHVSSASEFFGQDLPQRTVQALVADLRADPGPTDVRRLDFAPWAGAYNRVAPHATAFAHRDSRFLLTHTAATAEATTAGRLRADTWLRRSRGVVHGLGTGGVYPNFPDRSLTDWPTAYHGPNYDRLVAVKRAYDADDVFRFHQSVPTSSS